jgi:hypothetical protein
MEKEMNEGGGKSSGGKNSPQLVDEGGGHEKLATVIQAINQIQQIAAMERSRVSTPIPPGFFGVMEQTDICAVAAKKVILTSLFTFAFTPLVIEVFERGFPILGEEPTMLGKIITLMLGFGFSFVQASLFASIGKCYVGNYTKRMINWFFLGICLGAAAKAIFGLIAYNFIALYLLSPIRLKKFVLLIGRFMSTEHALAVYQGLSGFSPTLIHASGLIVMSSFIIVAWPSLAIWRQKRINRLTQQIFQRRKDAQDD